MAGTVPGQPQRRRLKIDDDPFGAVGDYAGAFLIKSAVELSGGYDTNPGRTFLSNGLPLWVVAPEFLAVSNWERHALVADLRGSFTGYGGSLPQTIGGQINPAPTNVDRPDFTGHVDGRLDVTEDFDLTAQTRLRVTTDNPGSPNIQAGLASYPVYASFGGTFGFDQHFNRLQVSAGGTVDRTVYQESTLTDGEHSSNDDRNFNQYGGISRVSYELKPGLKPFVEVEGDTRVQTCRSTAAASARFQRRLYQGRLVVRVLAAVDRRSRGRLDRAHLRRSQARPAAGPAYVRFADLDSHAAHHRQVRSRYPDSETTLLARPASWCTPTRSRSITTSAAG